MVKLPYLDCGCLHEQIESCLTEFVQVGEDEGIPIYSEVDMASAAKVQVFIDEKLKRCVAALQKIAMLADTGSDVYKEFAAPYLRMGDKPSGWRIAEEMRQVANDVVESLPLEEDLTIYKRAMESMATQFIHPKTTALELAKSQLGIDCGKRVV